MNRLEQESHWLFPGQGSQEVGMGRRLLQVSRRAMEFLHLAQELAGLPLIDVMRRGPDSLLSQTEFVQPAVVAISCGYVNLLQEAGYQPKFVAGHSLGEYSALYAAGVLSIEDTLRIAVERGRLMSRDASGGMLAVKSVELATLEHLIEQVTEGSICLANLNAPSQLVVSGEDAGLDALNDLVQAAGGSTVRLNVSGAWHSPLVAVAAMEFQKILSCVTFNTPKFPVVMASTTSVAGSASDIRDTMMRQMIVPVRWYEVIEKLMQSGCRQFLEVGPGKVLKGLMRRILPNESSYSIQGLELNATIDMLVNQAAARSPQGVRDV